METKQVKAKVLVSLLALVGLVWLCPLALAGDLEPTAPPAPTMKTLDEVEPRIPIHAVDLPLTIATPGSYYLAENITTSGGGITIDANNVTIDLMGFSLAGGTGNGIFVDGSQKNIAIKNGTVSGWTSVGVNAFAANNNQLANLRASDNGSWGVNTGWGSTVTNCTARQNGGRGISTGNGCTVTNCTASYNGGDGIVAGTGGTVSGCTAFDNVGDGIQVSWRSLVVGNTCSNNGNGGDGAGIHVVSFDNRIEANNVTNNDRGIDVDESGNLIIKNSASGNFVTNYDIVSGNSYGQIINVAGVGSFISTDPWANFTF